MSQAITEISIFVALGLFLSALSYHLFMLLISRLRQKSLSKWVFFETGMYQNEETGDVIVVPDEEMKLVEHGQNKGKYVKVKEEGQVYFYDKIIEEE